MAWAPAALERLPADCMSHLSPLLHAVQHGADIRASTAFSGIDAPVVSIGMITSALKAYRDALPADVPARGLQVTNVFAVENNAS
eukprot:2178680-Pyramimonas_sp.AAC.1